MRVCVHRVFLEKKSKPEQESSSSDSADCDPQLLRSCEQALNNVVEFLVYDVAKDELRRNYIGMLTDSSVSSTQGATVELPDKDSSTLLKHMTFSLVFIFTKPVSSIDLTSSDGSNAYKCAKT